MLFINTVCEDFLSEVVVEKIIGSFGDRFKICNRYITDGNSRMKRNLRGYSQASAYTPFCIVTDLDNETCAPALITSWANKIQLNDNLIFRVAVREIETWVMADRNAFSKFSGIPLRRIPLDLETVTDPKATLFSLVENYGKKTIRQDLLPADATATVGPGYNLVLSEFVYKSWDPNRAQLNSNSLYRMIRHLSRLNQ